MEEIEERIGVEKWESIKKQVEEIGDDALNGAESLEEAMEQAEVIIDLIDFEVNQEFAEYVTDMVLDYLDVYLAAKFGKTSPTG